MTSASRVEREELCALFESVGEEAPTLCEGWDAGDLAAHLVVRERRPDAAAGLVVPWLAGHTGSVQDALRRRKTFGELVGLVRGGPVLVGLVPAVERAMNTVEYFVHHEDVRRAQEGWKPRDLDDALEEELWRTITKRGRLLFRKSPVAILVRRPSGESRRLVDGAGRVELTGKPSELLLYAFGRKDHALVEVTGDADAVQRFQGTDLSL
ncbi:TIGR03085 family metal-binding protein [Actinocorallia longicatena]|uniref:TIGR03085 family metal-binding protein n=1 Tax=Actinocorallia longicatena TaxID=111803 RepID=A0ABP6QHJ6_9ACTN